MTKTLNRVGIIGAGTMGRRIAFECVNRGKRTNLYDKSPEAVEEARKDIEGRIKSFVSENRLDTEMPEISPSCLTISPSLEDCVEGAELVIEAVSEDLKLKRTLFAEIGKCSQPETLIATNTSSLTGSQLADSSGRPEKFINLHFGHHGDLKVDVMGHPLTSPDTVEAVIDFVKSLGLVPILVRREIMGYASNRVWRAVKKEVLFLLDGGYATPEDIDRGWMLEWETTFGPCGIMDLIGLDVVRDIENVYYETSGDPSDRPPPMLLDMIEQGKLGEKTGEGFYTYPDPAYKRTGWLLDRDE